MLGEKEKKQIIFEAETLATLVATSLWQSLFDNRRAVLFVDNEGTKFSLLKGVSDNACVDTMAEICAELECRLHTTMWIARVPTKSNIADPPSRGITRIPLLANAEDVSVRAGQCLLEIVSQITKKGETAARLTPVGKHASALHLGKWFSE